MRRRALLAASASGGGGGAAVITFYIQSPIPLLLERHAEEGMTWQEWVNSDYNLQYRDKLDQGFESQYFEVTGDMVTHYEEGYPLLRQGNLVKPTDVIYANALYNSPE